MWRVDVGEKTSKYQELRLDSKGKQKRSNLRATRVRTTESH